MNSRVPAPDAEIQTQELTDTERRQISAESQALLTRATARQRKPMSRQAQAQPPTPPPSPQPQVAQVAPPAPPAPEPPAAPVQAQMDENQPMVPPVGPGAPQGQGMPPAPMPPAGPGMPAAQAPAAPGIEQFVEEKEEEAAQPVTDAEAGFKNPTARRYLSVYGHLKIRATAQRVLEVYDPVEPRRALLRVTPNKKTRENIDTLKQAALMLSQTILDNGLARTAQLCKGRAELLTKTADSIADGGTTVMADPPTFPPRTEGTRGDGASVNRGTGYDENGVTSATNEGDGLTVKEPHDKRTAPGLGGKSATQTGGVQNDTQTNMADGPKPESSAAMDVAKGGDTTGREKPEEPKKDVLEDAVTVFADESLTGKGKNAQAKTPPAGPVEPGPLPEGAEDAPLDEVEARYAAFYAAKCKRDVRASVQKYIKKFVRCATLAMRRQALNLEESPIKVAMADALLNTAQVSPTEDYTGMDVRTASYCIEAGLNQSSMTETLNAIMHRAAAFMKMSDEAFDQLEQDADNVSPAPPQAQFDPGMMPPVESQAYGAMDPGMGMPMQGQGMPDPGMMPMQGQGMPDPGMMPPVQGQDMMPESPMGGDGMPPVEGQDMPPPPAPPAPPAPVQARAQDRRNAALAGNMPVNTGLASHGQPTTRSLALRESLRQSLSTTAVAAQSKMMLGR